MLAELKIENKSSFFIILEAALNQKGSLYILSNRMDWNLFDKEIKFSLLSG